tara:strand:- start:627 stop:914 length:288 start_codon:yes stop_codon:yes gene_type:complete
MKVLCCLVALFVFAAGSAHAQMPCVKYDDVVKRLNEMHQEKKVAHGLTMLGSLYEVYASDSGSWTMISVTPRGVACPVGSGQGWQMIIPKQGKGA